MTILAIETSCDETAVAVTKQRTVLSSVIESQINDHVLYGGVVPEIASRRHIESISSLYKKALEQANITINDIDAIAVTYTPGLIGALLVGVNFAKSLAFALDKPLVPVHHLRSHIAANYIINPDLEPPFLSLVVSGGHSHLIHVKSYTTFETIGRTRDDAAGECFDKTARALGLPYPGGVHLDKIAEQGNENAYTLPRPSVEGNDLDLSFSGLKTAVINQIHKHNQKNQKINTADMAASVRKAVCDLLIDKTITACERFNFKKLAIAGGVAANSLLRKRIKEESKKRKIKLYIPPLFLCGDNAAMVGVQGYYEYINGNIASEDLNAYATMDIGK